MSIYYDGKKTSIWSLSAPRKNIGDDFKPVTWGKKKENNNAMYVRAQAIAKKKKMAQRAKK